VNIRKSGEYNICRKAHCNTLTKKQTRYGTVRPARSNAVQAARLDSAYCPVNSPRARMCRLADYRARLALVEEGFPLGPAFAIGTNGLIRMAEH
jgi:hypothetical protein